PIRDVSRPLFMGAQTENGAHHAGDRVRRAADLRHEHPAADDAGRLSVEYARRGRPGRRDHHAQDWRSVLAQCPHPTSPGARAAPGPCGRTVKTPHDYYGRAKVGALTLTGIDAIAAPQLRGYSIKAGRFLRLGDEAATVITVNLADNLGLKLGDKLHLPTA